MQGHPWKVDVIQPVKKYTVFIEHGGLLSYSQKHVTGFMSRTTCPSSKLSVTYHNMLLIYVERLTGLHPTPKASRHLCVSCPSFLFNTFTSPANSGHVMLHWQGTKLTRLIYILYAFIFSMCMLSHPSYSAWYDMAENSECSQLLPPIHKLPHNYCKYPVKLCSTNDNCSSQRLLSLQL